MTGHAWTAQWLGAAGAQKAAATASGSGFGRTLFRSTLDLTSDVPASATARVSADSAYVLYVNGIEAARGPQRAQPRRKRHDVVEIAHLLRPGRNALACIVTFYGRSNAVWQAAVPSGALGRRAALLFDGRVGDIELGSALRWRAIESPAWTDLPRRHLEGVASVVHDARLLDPGWCSEEHDDSAWPLAVPVPGGHRGRAGAARPPIAPFGHVPERTGKPLDETRRVPSVRSVALAAGAGSAGERSHPGDLADAGRPFEDGGSEQTTMTVAPGQALVVRADFGRIVSGLLEFDVVAPEGTVVDVAFHERLAEGDGALSERSGERYIARGARDRFRPLERHGMRAATILLRPPAAFRGELQVNGIELREQLRPWSDGPFFRSSDDELVALWHAGVRTVHLNTLDGFTDCPTREQRAWVGDGVVHSAVHLVSNDDWGAVLDYLVLSASPREDGILPMSAAGDLEAADGVTIPSWSLHWIHALWEYFMHAGTGDIAELLPTARGVLSWFARRLSGAGAVTETGEWDLVDWSSVYVAGESAALTALWGRALREYASMTRALGDAASADWAQTNVARAERAFERFWDPRRRLYVDYLAEDGLDAPTSQAVNAAAVAAGLVPRERIDDLVTRISDPGRLVIRTMYATPEGRVDAGKWDAVSSGARVVDWDPENEIVRAEPFFSSVVHDAYLAAGRPDLVRRAVRDWSRFLSDGFDTFGETWLWGTPCHGWSATPTKDITRSVLGVQPIAPGYERARVAPRPGDVLTVTGAVPTPHGLIRVDVADGVATIDTPVPALFDPVDGSPVPLEAGRHRVRLADGSAS
ncbi:hypothetical protein N8K70_00415 [Microbacterium betulae]|uniref:Alpha-L-rhamnosidase n=1 Tax=Microbacterium betulae TaxID=2981139 RepID=A0AA97FI77_9MICO|nr:alpha-L-rhamnosidase C-terminal domain-containing protein [Microbacterium sp. AB]WOF23163.1 hypothetical protein N8K70_00415 [Microbacterium sp. AB]